MNEFQYRLQKSLAASGMTASELSEKSGISKANISNYINGAYIPKSDKCYLLAEALHVDPGWLMTGEEPTKPPEDKYVPKTIEARSLARGMDTMPEARRKAFMEFMISMAPDIFGEGKEDDDT